MLNKTGKIVDDAVHPLALDQLGNHNEGIVVLVVRVERVGIGAVIDNHVAHMAAVAADELPGGLAAGHNGHMAHE